MRSSRDSNSPSPQLAPAAGERTAVVTVVHQIRPHGVGTRPALKLMGDWLARAGFTTGTYAVLQATPGRIVIEAQGHLSEPGAEDHRRRLRAGLRAS
jgi:hypothetical protein